MKHESSTLAAFGLGGVGEGERWGFRRWARYRERLQECSGFHMYLVGVICSVWLLGFVLGTHSVQYIWGIMVHTEKQLTPQIYNTGEAYHWCVWRRIECAECGGEGRGFSPMGGGFSRLDCPPSPVTSAVRGLRRRVWGR